MTISTVTLGFHTHWTARRRNRFSTPRSLLPSLSSPRQKVPKEAEFLCGLGGFIRRQEGGVVDSMESLGAFRWTREAEGVTECREREGGGDDGGLSVQSVAGNHTAVADTSGLGLASLQWQKKQDSSHAAIPLYHPRARVGGWGYKVTMDGGCFWRKTLVSMDATSDLTQQDLTGTLQTMHWGAYKFFLVERFFF